MNVLVSGDLDVSCFMINVGADNFAPDTSD